MSFSAMLNHKCDVYHIVKTDKSPGYGLPSSPSFSYPETPDIQDLPCHFNIKSGGLLTNSIQQTEPYAVLDGSIKLVLPFGSDIRLNDKIINRENGLEYTAGVPVNVRGHHMYVMLRRTDEQQPIGAVNYG
jgi:hypothetical protein